jgi:exodeoxyribonuclease V alpha subunit
MIIFGIFNNIIWSDEYTGESYYTIKTDDNKAVFCRGTNPSIPYGFPLKVEGEYYKDRSGKRYIKVSNYELYADNEVLSIKFLTQFLSQTKATTVAKSISDIFGFVEEKDCRTILSQLAQITLDESNKIIDQIVLSKAYMELIKQVVLLGGDVSSAFNLFNKYHNNSLQVLEKNPYLGLLVDIPIAVCEKKARSIGFVSSDEKRVHAITHLAMMQNHHNGNTCILFQELCSKFHHIEKNAGSYQNTEPLFIAAELANDIYVIDDDCKIYLKEDYEIEQNIAGNIRRLQNHNLSYNIPEELIKRVEEKNQIVYEPEQKAAFNILKTPGLKVITGGPGTGKTTLLKGLVEVYKYVHTHDGTIALCAPTGCAAKRIIDSTGMNAKTIHKLLEIQPCGDYIKCKDKYNKLDIDLLVIDEASMVDAKLFSMLLDAVKDNATVLIIGDEDQLPSVGAGNILHDLIASGKIELIRLKTVKRQAGSNSIVSNSMSIKTGQINNLIHDDRSVFYTFNDEASLKIALINEYKNNPGAKIYTTARRKDFVLGSISINKELQKLTPNSENCAIRKGIIFKIGDKVLFTANNYDFGYFNGDTGQIEDIGNGPKGKVVSIKSDSGDIFYLTGKELDDIELGYCLTTHKAQGSECNTAFIVLPKTPKSLLTRQLLYVAATRAKEKNIFFIEDSALKDAVMNARQFQRTTGLIKKICAV